MKALNYQIKQTNPYSALIDEHLVSPPETKTGSSSPPKPLPLLSPKPPSNPSPAYNHRPPLLGVLMPSLTPKPLSLKLRDCSSSHCLVHPHTNTQCGRMAHHGPQAQLRQRTFSGFFSVQSHAKAKT
ncbi:hypothetical protein GBA52_017591 [Prunus armeniaca]|nr:hypothetical protein GBA52_017591 [Prunus armeniaca]